MRDIADRRRRSARETFQNCRARYKAEYLDGIDMSSEATRRGNAWHAAREIYVRGLWEVQQTDNAEMAAFALSEARKGTPGLTHESWLDLESLWSRWVPEFRLDLKTFYSVEGALPYFATLMRFDMVTVPQSDTILIEDDKTHWRIPHQSTLTDSWQTGMYLAAARGLFPGFRTYAMRYNFVRYMASSDIIVKSDAELDVIEQSIKESDEAMADAEDRHVFPATGGKHCGTCALAASGCPQSQRTVGFTTEQMIERIAWIDAQKSWLIGALRVESDERGPLRGGGIEWAHRPKTTAQYPADQVLATFAKREMKPPTLLLSATALKTVVNSTRKYAGIADAIKQLAITKASTEFSGKPIVQDEDDAALVEAE